MFRAGRNNLPMASMVKIPAPPKHRTITKAKFVVRGSAKAKPAIPARKPIPPKKFKYPSGKLIVVNRTEQIVTAYQNGIVFHTCECVLGRISHRTPTGCNFYVTDKDPDHESDEYPGALMHWAVFFDLYRGLALHQYHGDTSGIEWLRLRGMQALYGSAGCVRLKEKDAKKIYHWADRYTTKVWVIDGPPERGGC